MVYLGWAVALLSAWGIFGEKNTKDKAVYVASFLAGAGVVIACTVL